MSTVRTPRRTRDSSLVIGIKSYLSEYGYSTAKKNVDLIYNLICSDFDADFVRDRLLDVDTRVLQPAVRASAKSKPAVKRTRAVKK